MDRSPRPTAFLRPAIGPRLDRRLVVAGGSVLMAIWLSLVYASWLQYESARIQGTVAVSFLARQVEDWTQGVLSRVVALIASTEAQLQAGPPPGEVVRILESFQATEPRLFRRIEVTAADGTPIVSVARKRRHSSAASPIAPIDDQVGLAIGPLQQIDGEMVLIVSRALVNADGQQVARLRVEIAPEHLAGLDGSLALPPRAEIAVIRPDGEILAATTDPTGQSSGDALLEFTRSQVARDGRGSAMIRGLDGAMRLVAHRGPDDTGRSGARIAEDPGLSVVAGLREEDVFAEADRRTLLFGLIATLVSLLALAGGRRLLGDQAKRAISDRDLAIAAEALGSIDVSIAVIDAAADDRNVIAVNRDFAALLARPAEELLGQPWRVVIGENGMAWLNGDGKPRETRYARPDGETSWLEVRVAGIPGSDRHGALAVVALRDITQRKQTELAMLRAKNQAEIANRAKSDFLANMSHELRTPLNAILGFSEIISKQLLGPVGTVAYREYAADIWSSGSHLLNIISDILDFAKIEAATLKLEETELDLARLVGTCVRFMSSRSNQAEVEVVVDIAPNFPHLIADDLRLKQIVLNLLSNAVKFSPRGGKVVIKATQTADGQVEIQVIDNGCGMSATDLEAAMQPFRQIESTMVKRAEGTGLGLPLAKRLVELHGGQLIIDTAPQRGTTVTVRLPGTRNRAMQAAA